MHRGRAQGHFTHGKQTVYLPILYSFTNGEGNEATSPSFSTLYVAIEGTDASLEALIATLLPAGGNEKEPLCDGNQASNCRQIFVFLHRWRPGKSVILRADQRFNVLL